jgi:hypothetical protein
VIRDAFRQFDQNGDGVVSVSELKEVLQNISGPGAGNNYSDAGVEWLMDDMDENLDGAVDYCEFTNWVRHEGDGAAEIMELMTISKGGVQPEVGQTRDISEGCLPNLLTSRNRSIDVGLGKTKKDEHLIDTSLPNLLNTTCVSHSGVWEPKEASARRLDTPSRQPKGPERFFYDKSTYTGTHARGGPDHVPKGLGTSVCGK